MLRLVRKVPGCQSEVRRGLGLAVGKGAWGQEWGAGLALGIGGGGGRARRAGELGRARLRVWMGTLSIVVIRGAGCGGLLPLRALSPGMF